jgi:hypothetical protein
MLFDTALHLITIFCLVVYLPQRGLVWCRLINHLEFGLPSKNIYILNITGKYQLFIPQTFPSKTLQVFRPTAGSEKD